MTTQLTEDLIRARNHLENNWFQGSWGEDPDNAETCKVCALGAINWALVGDPWPHSLRVTPGQRQAVADRYRACEAALEEVLKDHDRAVIRKEMAGINLIHVPKFNDSPYTDEAEVLAVFDEAIARSQQ